MLKLSCSPVDPQETSLHRSKLRASFDHLVGSGKQRERDCEAKRLGRLGVDDQRAPRRPEALAGARGRKPEPLQGSGLGAAVDQACAIEQGGHLVDQLLDVEHDLDALF